jgi:hypothetical protein
MAAQCGVIFFGEDLSEAGKRKLYKLAVCLEQNPNFFQRKSGR